MGLALRPGRLLGLPELVEPRPSARQCPAPGACCPASTPKRRKADDPQGMIGWAPADHRNIPSTPLTDHRYI